MPEEKRTIRARRRRRTSSSAPREQAATPTRERPPAPRPAPPRPPSGGGGGFSPRPPSLGSGGAMPAMPGGCGGKLGCLGIGLVLLLVFIFILPKLMGGEAPRQPDYQQPQPQQQSQQPPAQQSPATPAPIATVAVAQPQAASGEGETWLVMLYQDADDKILEKDIDIDLNEAERAGSSDRVQIVAQLDRYRGGFRGDGDWTATKRFYVTFDPDLNRLASREVMDIGEANMADGDTLVEFVQWAVQNYPADKYALILSDHGMGWPGGWSDPTARGRGADNLPLASAMGDHIYLTELDRSLAKILQTTGIQQFEFIGLDACLMAHAEVFAALQPYARYAVASQETEPAVGWAYASFLRALLAHPDMNGGELGQAVVKSYIQDDQRIVDDRARAEMVGRRGISARQVAQKMEDSATLSAIDLQTFPNLMAALNQFAFVLQNANQKAVAKARSYAQSYTSVFGRNARPSYLDLGNFVQLVKREVRDEQVQSAADGVLAALQQTTIAEVHGRNKPGSNGMSIYFPTSRLYLNRVAGGGSYEATADRFARESLWDDFLAYHYTGRRFKAKPGAPPPQPKPQDVKAPGAGKIQVSPIKLSAKSASAGNPVLISADIQGENLGYIYIFTGLLDQKANALFVADMDYLESGESRTVGGVTYPDWGQGEFTLEFEWEPLFFGINDGRRTVTALFSPQRYGASYEEAVYSVDGIYSYADGEQRYARLYFDNGTGQLKQVFGYTDKDFTGAAREILPQPGDQFTVLEKWFDLDASGKLKSIASQQGDTITFGDAPIEWRELDAPPGVYQVGFVVQDLDGKSQPVYASIIVK